MKTKLYRVQKDFKIKKQNNDFVNVKNGMAVHCIKFAKDFLTKETVFLCAYPNIFHHDRFWQGNSFTPTESNNLFIAHKEDLKLVKTKLSIN
jgi:hypothetical protein